MILITGATGYVGIHLTEQLLKRDYDIFCIGRSLQGKEYYNARGIPFAHVDVTKAEEFDKLPKKDIDAVVHLAAFLPEYANESTAPLDFLNINTLGTLNVLEYCKKIGVKKFIFTTTLWEVGKLLHKGKISPISENAVDFYYTGDHAAYVISKLSAIEYIKHYSQECGMNYVILRSAAIFGLRSYGIYLDFHKDGLWDKNPPIFDQTVWKAINSKPIEIWGDCSESSEVKNYIYVKDVANCIISTLNKNNKNSSGRYNIGSDDPITIEYQMKSIAKIFSPKNNPSKLIYRPELPGYGMNILLDNSKMKRDLGPLKYSYEDALIDIKSEIEKSHHNV